jgi:ribonuclease HII
VAAAVLLPPRCDFPWLARVRDSKVLSAARRQELARRIRKDALAVGLGMMPHDLVDSFGIIEATRRAMLAALGMLSAAPEFVLIDALALPRCRLPHRPIIHGDGLSLSIACASIVAKVARDRMMLKADSHFSGYGFARNKGYATREHLEALTRLGPCPIHRRTFAPVRACLECS